MIYQLSKKIKQYPINRFQQTKWNIKFNGESGIDAGGVKNQAITIGIQSFLSLKSGICIKSPNYANNELNADLSDVQVIPYTLNDDQKSRDALFAFGVF